MAIGYSANVFSTPGIGFPAFNQKSAIVPYDTISSELQRAHDAAIAEGRPLDLKGQTYDITSRVTLRPNRLNIQGNYASFNCTNMTDTEAVLMQAAAEDTPYDGKAGALMHVKFSGPGSATALKVSGEVANRSARPTLYNVTFSDFDVGVDMVNYAYLSQFIVCEWRNMNICIQQSAGTDAGENCAIYGGAAFNSNLAVRLVDSTSEWFAFGFSVDYTNQLALLQGAPSHLSLSCCHVEPRGKSDTGDRFILAGTGADSRAAVATKDSYIDIDGNGSNFSMYGGKFDVNNSGGLGKYAYDHLVNVRHKNSYGIFRDVWMQNMDNTANQFWVGPGLVTLSGTKMQSIPSMMSRLTAEPRGNALRDGGMEDSTLQDLWYVSKDTATITSRTTGTNITVARSTVQKRSGASSLLFTKVGAGSGQVSCIIPATPGRMFSVFGYSFLSSAPGGSLFAECRWANCLGLDANGVPIVVSAAGVPVHSDVTLSSTTGSWQPFEIKVYDDGTSGDFACPAWANCMRLVINMDSVGALPLYLDDLVVSPW
jgi:hypothetical protein